MRLLIVVGGSRRKVGKTTMVENLIRENVEAGWVAIKITSHGHPPTLPGRGDTERYLAAGAREAELLQASDLAPAIIRVRKWMARGANLIVESTRILDHIQPDVAILVVDPANEIKDACLRNLSRGHVIIQLARRFNVPLFLRP